MGGTVPQCAEFIASLSSATSCIVTTPDTLRGVGPFRVISEESGGTKSERFVPSLAESFEVSRREGCLTLSPKVYGPQFVSCKVPQPNAYTFDVSDKVTLEVPMISSPAWKLVGEFQLGRGIPKLNTLVEVHPFFQFMWVYLNAGGTRPKEVWTEIARLVGGRLVDGPTANSYKLEPDYPRVMRRCLASLDYYGNWTDEQSPYRTKIQARLAFFKALDAAQWRRVIDATDLKPLVLPLQKGSPVEKVALDLFEHLRQSDNPSIQARLPEVPRLQAEIGAALSFTFTFIDKNGQKSHL